MTSFSATLANALWWASSRPAARDFRRGARHARDVQEAWLRQTLHRNARTRYGRRCGFDRFTSIEAWQDRVPTVRYEDLEPDIEAIRSGEPGVLTADPVRLLQPTSGSTGGSKLIPYTDQLRSEYRRAVAVWIDSLFRNDPGLALGRAYWSISPDTDPRLFGPSTVPIGFDDDASYLGDTTRHLIRRLAVVPHEVRNVWDLDTFRYATLRFLLAAEDIRLFSVWSPTFLTLLIGPMSTWWDALIADLYRGRLEPPENAEEPWLGSLRTTLRPLPERAAALRDCGPSDPRRIWPHLRLISCWADGPSKTGAHQVREIFPGIPVQPKGLIATEAFVSIPLADGSGSVPAYTSHFFEFISTDSPERRPCLLDSLEEGGRYEIVVTTGGGLYRYRLGDIVDVVTHRDGLPVLRFIGRSEGISDRFGEKLNEVFVGRVLADLETRFGLTPRFSLLVPEEDGSGARYVWLLEEKISRAEIPASLLPQLAQALEESLCANFHYALCRRLGQLQSAAAAFVAPGAAEAYLRHAVSTGRRLGDVKIPSLDPATGWPERLSGEPSSAVGR